MDKKKQRKCPLHHTFRCSEDTQAMLESLMEQTLYSKSELEYTVYQIRINARMYNCLL